MVRIATLLAMLTSVACGRLGFSEQPNLDGGADAATDGPTSTPFVGACPGESLACSGSIACHDFESNNFDDWSYECDGDNFQCSPTIPEVALETVQAPACNGQRIYRAFTEGGPGTRQNAYLGLYVDEEMIDQFYVRFALRFPAGTNIERTGMMLMPLLPEGTANGPRFGFGNTSDELRLRFLEEDFFIDAGLSADQWACIELRMKPSYAEVWVDDVSVFVREGQTIPNDTRFDVLTLGITGSADGGETEFFFDDFAISPNRIGCTAPQ